MPLSDKEKSGFHEILDLIQDSDLISVANTVSHNVLKFLTRKDAVESIITYTNHPFELLKRKKIRRDTLFTYADKFSIAECLPSDTKKELIRKILSSWSSGYDVEDMEEDESLLESFQPQLTFPQCFPQQESNTFFHQKRLPSQNFTQYGSQFNQPSNQNAIQCLKQCDLQPQAHFNIQESTNDIELNCWYDADLQASDEDKELSLQFCKWFYSMMNNLTNNHNNSNTDTLNSHHFFDDCTMNLVTENHSGKHSEVVCGCELVCNRMKNLTISSSISYNPNMSDRGLRTLCDRFGRRVLIVAGTIHAAAHVGLFEQQFGLVRDADAGYNWKIKFTRLALSNHTPCLPVSLENTKHVFSIRSS